MNTHIITKYNSPILNAMFITKNVNELNAAMETLVSNIEANPTKAKGNRFSLIVEAQDALEAASEIIKNDRTANPLTTKMFLNIVDDITESEKYILNH